jgi:hypothetical protein
MTILNHERCNVCQSISHSTKALLAIDVDLEGHSGDTNVCTVMGVVRQFKDRTLISHLRTAISISTQNKLLLPRSHPHGRANQRASTLLLPACCEAQPGHHVRQHDSLSERPPSPRSCRNSATSARHMSSQMTPTIAESAVIGLVCMAVVDAWCVTHSEADTIAQINPLKHAIALR